MHKVRHDDQCRLPVHDPTTNELHLNIPSNDCGQRRRRARKFHPPASVNCNVAKLVVVVNHLLVSRRQTASQHSISFSKWRPVTGYPFWMPLISMSGRVAAVEHILTRPRLICIRQRGMKIKKKGDAFGVFRPL
jgi:hypothetical protein